MSITKFLISQIFATATLFLLMLTNAKKIEYAKEDLTKSCFETNPGIMDSCLGRNHDSLDIIFWTSIVGLILNFALYSEVPKRTKAIAALFWLLIVLLANPTFR